MSLPTGVVAGADLATETSDNTSIGAVEDVLLFAGSGSESPDDTDAVFVTVPDASGDRVAVTKKWTDEPAPI